MECVLFVFRLEMQGDRRSLRSILDRGDGVGALAARLPLGRRALAGLVRQQLDLVGHHEGGIETDTELTDQLLGDGGVFLPRATADAARRYLTWPGCRSGRRPRRGSCRCRCRGRSGSARPCRPRCRCADRRCRPLGPCSGTLQSAACPAHRRRSRSAPAEMNPSWSRPSGPSSPAAVAPRPETPAVRRPQS